MSEKCKILRVLSGNIVQPPPIWLMRQAGRHLPEYRRLRAKTDDFISFCSTPLLAVEASLQPVRRYGMDAVIIFSDILLLLQALGRPLRFEEPGGPVLEPLPSLTRLIENETNIPECVSRLSYVEEIIGACRERVGKEVAVIGFAGAPWTLSVYAVQGRVRGDTTRARSAYFRDRKSYLALISFLAEAVAFHLYRQARAGADVLMLFDSWSGSLDHASFNDLVVAPNAAVVRRLREMGVSVPVIGFPRAAGANIEVYAEKSHMDCISLDSSLPPEWINASLARNFPVQGNLDSLLLRTGGDMMDAATDHVLRSFSDRPLVFNLGHGVISDTPVENVERLVTRVRKLRSDAS